MLGLVKSCIGTKFTSQFGDLIAVSNLIISCCLGCSSCIFSFSAFILLYGNGFYN